MLVPGAAPPSSSAAKPQEYAEDYIPPPAGRGRGRAPSPSDEEGRKEGGRGREGPRSAKRRWAARARQHGGLAGGPASDSHRERGWVGQTTAARPRAHAPLSKDDGYRGSPERVAPERQRGTRSHVPADTCSAHAPSIGEPDNGCAPRSLRRVTSAARLGAV